MKRIIKYVLFIFLFFATLLIGMVITFVNSINFNSELDRVAIITDYVIQGNQTKYYELATSIFDDAKKCMDEKCRKKISLKIHENLKEMKGTPFYEGIYFIRINENGEIEKMFLHGEVKTEKVDTRGEKKVYDFLKSNTSELYLKGFRIDSMVSNMHYLNDYYSEAEIIVPIRTYDNGKVVGAILKGYGD